MRSQITSSLYRVSKTRLARLPSLAYRKVRCRKKIFREVWEGKPQHHDLQADPRGIGAEAGLGCSACVQL